MTKTKERGLSAHQPKLIKILNDEEIYIWYAGRNQKTEPWNPYSLSDKIPTHCSNSWNLKWEIHHIKIKINDSIICIEQTTI